MTRDRTSRACGPPSTKADRSSRRARAPLLLLIAVEDPTRYSRAAARWHGRFGVECGLSLEDDALALAALSSIRFSPAAQEMLAELGTRYRVANIEGVLRRFRPPARAGSASSPDF